jgi:transposase
MSMDAPSPDFLALLRQRIEELEQRIRMLEAENRHLREQLDEEQRRAARQAAPFRRRESKKIPEGQKKRPGRKPGHPGFSRAVPDHVDEHVEVPLNGCPGCGGLVDDVQPVEQFVEEIPPVRPHITRIVTYQGTCLRCGPVRSQHPLQMSEAKGAAKVQLGPRALALAAAINKRHGATLRTTCRLLHDMAGLRLTPGGLTQALQRVGRKVQGAYQQLITELRSRPAVFADETSWYVGGPGHWLWTFTSDTTTVYRVEPSRGRDMVTETLGPEFAGMLVSDCLASYESVPYRKHKCIAHHLRAIAEARKRPDTPDPSHLDQWKLLFQAVTGIWRARSAMGEAEFLVRRTALESWCDRLLVPARAQPGDEAIQRRIGKRRGDVLGCLYEPAAEPTNNRAERALRPAVIARKLSCGNKTEAGKCCFEILTSVATTCEQRGHELITWLASCLPLAAQTQPVPAPR